MPLPRSASVKARVVLRASSMRQALSRAAFSRSSRPMRPSRWERVTATSGHSSRRMAAASSSHEALSGEKTAATADRADARPRGSAGPPRASPRASKRHERAGRRTRGRPRASPPRRAPGRARSSGQSTKGGSEAPEGRPMRTAATRPRSRRCTTALVKWVVPIITACAARAPGACSPATASARVMPVVTSGGGGRLHRGRDRVLLEEHGVGVGAAHVDADAPSHANTERKSRS